MNFEIGQINHITFAVENIEKSIEFYEKVLKAKVLAKGEKLAYFEVAGIWIALNVEKNIPACERQQTYSHIAFSMTVSNQKKFIQHLELNDIEYSRGRPRDKREGQSVYLRDYDGHLFEFHSKTMTDRLKYYREEREEISVF